MTAVKLIVSAINHLRSCFALPLQRVKHDRSKGEAWPQ